MGNNVSWLTSVPAGDTNFKTRLKSATIGELQEALSILNGQEKVKAKVAAISREIRKRQKEGAE